MASTTTFSTALNSPASTCDVPNSGRSFTSDTTYLHVLTTSTKGGMQKPDSYIPTKLLSPKISINMYQNAHLHTSNSSPNLQADPQRDTLVHLMHSLRNELAQHRYLMLDIQSRISCLERETFGRDRIGTEEKQPGQIKDHRTSNIIRPESQITQNWWRTCQKFAQRSDTPVSIERFMGRKGCFSGFDFDFDVRRSQISNLTLTPKAIDAPQCSPASPAASITDSPEYHQVAFDHIRPRRRSKADILSQSGQDIVNQVVEVDKKQMPYIPLLQSPPQDRRSASSRASQYTDVTALPTLPAHQHSSPEEKSHSGFRGLKDKLKYKMSLRGAAAHKPGAIRY